MEHCILTYGCPIQIKSDLGTEYKNEIFRTMCKLLNIEHKFSTAYHPQTIGSLERNHRCLNEYLRHFINDQQDDWDNQLIYYTFTYNTTPHSEHLFTPFELIFGKQARLPTHFSETVIVDPIYNHESYVTELKYKLQLINNKARLMSEKAKQNRSLVQSKQSKPIQITIGDKVWLRNENRRKLDKVQSGPFEIISEDHPNVRIKNFTNEETQIVHKNRLIKV